MWRRRFRAARPAQGGLRIAAFLPQAGLTKVRSPAGRVPGCWGPRARHSARLQPSHPARSLRLRPTFSARFKKRCVRGGGCEEEWSGKRVGSEVLCSQPLGVSEGAAGRGAGRGGSRGGPKGRSGSGWAGQRRDGREGRGIRQRRTRGGGCRRRRRSRGCFVRGWAGLRGQWATDPARRGEGRKGDWTGQGTTVLTRSHPRGACAHGVL